MDEEKEKKKKDLKVLFIATLVGAFSLAAFGITGLFLGGRDPLLMGSIIMLGFLIAIVAYAGNLILKKEEPAEEEQPEPEEK